MKPKIFWIGFSFLIVDIVCTWGLAWACSYPKPEFTIIFFGLMRIDSQFRMNRLNV